VVRAREGALEEPEYTGAGWVWSPDYIGL